MRFRTSAVAVLGAAILLSACSSTAEDGGDEGSSEESSGVELRWRTRPDNQAEIDVYQQVSDDLDAGDEGVTLVYEPGGSESSSYQDVLKTELAAGTAPDVFWIPGTDIADFANRGLILDLRELADGTDHNDADFYEGPMVDLTTDPATGEPGSQLWGLPRDVSTFALYLNLDLISQAGADDPRVLAEEGRWDWPAFEAVAAKVSALGGANKGFGANSWWANYGYFVNSAGGSLVTEDGTACALDTPESIAGLTQMKKLYDGALAVPFGEDAEPPFKAGTVGMFMNGRWATPGTREVAFNWDVAPLPSGPAGSRNWLFWGAYVVNANTENPEQAWSLVQSLTSVDTQNQIAELGTNLPSRQSDETIDQFLGYTPPENNAAFVAGVQDNPVAEGPLWKGDWPAFSSVADAEVNGLMNNQQTIEQFQQSICQKTASAFTG